MIHTCGFSDNFIKESANFILKNFSSSGKDLDNIAVIFGGKRPAMFLKKELASRFRKPFLSPRFFSLSELSEYILRKKEEFSLISSLEASYLIFILARDKYINLLEGRDNFIRFFPWAREISAFIDRLDIELVEKAALVSTSAQADIGFDIPPNINALLADILKLRADYHSLLRKKKMYTRGLVFARIYELFTDKIPVDEFKQIVFCGLFYLHKSEKRLIKALSEGEKASFIFQADNDGWTVLDRLAGDLGLDIKPKTSISCFNRVSIYSAADRHKEAAILGDIMRGIDKDERTVIVIPKPENLPVYLTHIAYIIDKFNVSLGYPLKRSQPFALLRSVFQAQQTRREGIYRVRDYLRVLNHPYCKGMKIREDCLATTRILIHKIEEYLSSSEVVRRVFVSLSEIEKDAGILRDSYNMFSSSGYDISKADIRRAIINVHSMFFRSWEESDSFFTSSKLALDLLSNVLVQDYIASDGLALKIIDKIILFFEELSEMKFAKDKNTAFDIYRMIEDILKDQVVAFSGSPLEGLQVLGFFETRNINFDNVIFVDLNEGALPYLNKTFPLIPLEAMIRLGIERIGIQEEIQRYHFRRLISGAKKIFFIFEENKQKDKSRFVEELIWEEEKKRNKTGVININNNLFIPARPARGEIYIEKNPQIANYLKNDFTFSASSVDTYLKCPLMFYYRYVLRLKEKDTPFLGLDSMDVGIFIHSFLEEVYRPFVGNKLSYNAIFEKRFFSRFDKMFEDFFGGNGQVDLFILKEVARFRLKRFLRYEKNRNVGKIIFLEKEIRFTLPAGKQYISLVAKIDRVEKTLDEVMIIDYKTGALHLPSVSHSAGQLNTRDKIKKRIKSFQLPIYFYALESEVKDACMMNAALYSIKSPSLKTLFKNTLPYEERCRIMREIFLPALKHVLRDIINSDIPFYADRSNKRICENCDYKLMCRRPE